jgi:hypothetical protein
MAETVHPQLLDTGNGRFGVGPGLEYGQIRSMALSMYSSRVSAKMHIMRRREDADHVGERRLAAK